MRDPGKREHLCQRMTPRVCCLLLYFLYRSSKSSIQEFPLWRNRNCSVSAVSSRKFDPWPQWIKGSRVATAAAQDAAEAQI